MSEEFDTGYDVVIVGGGGSGLSCAVEAAEKGLSVALLEKEEQVGGNTAFAEGHAAFESDEQIKRGITVSKDEGFRVLMDYSHWNAKPELAARFVQNAATTVVKMRDQGIIYDEVLVMESDKGLPTWHIPKGEMAGVVSALSRSCERLGVDVFLQTRAQEILKAEDGSVAGLVATDQDGEEVRIGAPVVVLAGGGFGSNPELLGRYTRYTHPERIMALGADCATGDGFLMAEAAGGHAFSEMGTALLGPLMRGKTITSQTNCAGLQPYLWLDATGRRFCNEIVGLNFGHAGQTIALSKEGYIWTILDKAQVQHLATDGCEVGYGIYIPAGSPLDTLPLELEQDVEAGTTVFRSDTLEGLAGRIGVDPAVLTRDVLDYNASCEQGADPRFFKKQFLFPVAEPPFYALKMEASILVTTGGIDIDDHMRVLDRDDSPIVGLYSVGCDAGGLYGESYCMDINGTSAGFALTSGWLAADDAAELVAERREAAQTRG